MLFKDLTKDEGRFHLNLGFSNSTTVRNRDTRERKRDGLGILDVRF